MNSLLSLLLSSYIFVPIIKHLLTKIHGNGLLQKQVPNFVCFHQIHGSGSSVGHVHVSIGWSARP